MKILHASVNIAGQATIISRAQRKLGMASDVMVIFDNYKNINDIDLNLRGKSLFIKISKVVENFFKCVNKYDIYHFHWGRSLLPGNLDLIPLKFLNKKIVMQYWGSDIRQLDISKKFSLYTDDELRKYFPKVNNIYRQCRIKYINLIADKIVVGDYALKPYAKNSIVIRQALDLENLNYIGGNNKKDDLTIVHAPTNRGIKGTKQIIETINLLKKRYKINFILVEKKSRAEAINIYKKADVIVDDIMMGPYGILALESMALGKPVLCHTHKEHIKNYSDLATVNTSPKTLYHDLENLIINPDLRREIGIKGRKYVEANHDSIKIARELINLYQTL